MPAAAHGGKEDRTRRFSLTEEELTEENDANVLRGMLREQSATSEMLSVELAALRLECKALREGVHHAKVTAGLRSPGASAGRERIESCPDKQSGEGGFNPLMGETVEAPSGFKRRARTLSETSVDDLAGVERIAAGGRKRLEKGGRFSSRFDSDANASPSSRVPSPQTTHSLTLALSQSSA